MLGAPQPTQAGHFAQVQFDAAFAKIRARKQPYWADPYRRRPNEVQSLGGDGRLVYFEDPNGHFLEIRTRPSRA